MSKAFVIKNKEGEYLQFFDEDSDDIGFTDDLTLAELYDKNEKDIMEKAYSNMGWEYIEITLAETKDLKQDINENLEQQLAEKDEEMLAKNKEILDLKLRLRALSSYYNEVVKKYEDVVNEVISIKSTIVSQSIELVKGCIDDLKNFLYKLDLLKDTQDCAGKYIFEKFIEEYTKGLEKEDE